MSTQAFRVGQTARLWTHIHSAARPGVLYPCCQRLAVLASKMKVAERRGRLQSARWPRKQQEEFRANEVTEDTEKKERAGVS